jgi:hypothetical protein
MRLARTKILLVFLYSFQTEKTERNLYYLAPNFSKTDTLSLAFDRSFFIIDRKYWPNTRHLSKLELAMLKYYSGSELIWNQLKSSSFEGTNIREFYDEVGNVKSVLTNDLLGISRGAQNGSARSRISYSFSYVHIGDNMSFQISNGLLTDNFAYYMMPIQD